MSAGSTAFDPDWLPGLLKQLDLPTAADVPVRALQVRYIRIDRDGDGRASFTASYYGTAEEDYFYPASTVKLPLVLATLEKLNRTGIPGLTDAVLSVAGYPPTTIRDCIRKIFLVSDNEAANRLYDFMGQQELNRIVHGRGYVQTYILHRFGFPGRDTDPRRTPKVSFQRQGRLIYSQPGAFNEDPFPPSPEILYEDGQREVFSGRNRTTLRELLEMIRSIVFPDSMDSRRRFDLTADDLAFLQCAMCRLPAESADPGYDPELFPADYAKFLVCGEGDAPVPPGVRIFNKCGWALGFLSDAAYLCDIGNGVEFMLAATLRVCSDGREGEDHYKYAEGKAFLRRLSRLIYRHELERPRKYSPDLSRYSYSFHGQEQK